MTQKSLVFVVGAGASCEAGLPSGKQLRAQIADALNYQVELFRRSPGGDDLIWEAMDRLGRTDIAGAKKDINAYIAACRAIKAAMPQAESIDNFIESRREDREIAVCGKLAIARCIADTEKTSKLWVDPGNIYNTINFKGIEETWYAAFFQLLVQGCDVTAVRERLTRIAFVTFNYDRCIEHFIHGALQNYFSLTSEQAADILKELEIFHAYGHLGPLPWQGVQSSTAFGTLRGVEQLLSVAERLKTFTEGTDPSHSDIVAIRRLMQMSERIVYLGFSYSPQNLALLYGEPKALAIGRKIFGTASGLSEGDVQEVSRQLRRLGNDEQSEINLRRDLQCTALFDQYRRSLSLP